VFSIGITNFGEVLSSFIPKGMHLSLVTSFVLCLYFHNSTSSHFLAIGYKMDVKFL
jgi:hypothetical protein